MNTVLDDWKIHCLRVQRPYINFDFENPSLLNTKLLQLPTNDQPAIYREMEDTNVMGVVDYDDDDGGRSYLRNSYDNIKEVIKKIAHKERHVVVYGFVGDYGYRDVAFLNHHYDLGYLKKNIRNKKGRGGKTG